ncbi:MULTISPECIES: hypothetical protein [unclassified Brevibacterium]|uniref:hypothetical protein n=1 Tax=unclassified Brevibacterium TaxID=2614124 RepID=UPI0010F46FC1|nr:MULTISPECIES: hypothetical protein [unclassified Brevibacterium]MCM1011512.1 hypothetical protein [Brevibacterium sp. XM4083]
MDTSIIVVIAIAVVFVVVVPALIRRSATEISRIDLDRVPDDARVVRAESQNPCRDEAERVTIFRAEAAQPSVPRIGHTPAGTVPSLRLSAQTPELAVIDGDGESRAEAVAPDAQIAEPQQLPVAVGESASTFVSAGHDPAHAADVRPLHPAVRAVFSQAPSGPTNSANGGTGRLGENPQGPQQPTSAGRTQPLHPRGGGADRPTTTAARAQTPVPGPATPEQTARDTEDPAMTESAARLRESLRSTGTMVRGFALVFLASVLGILVTGALALVSVVHPALIGVFAGLAVVSLFIVRTLNLRKRDIKRQLRGFGTTPVRGRESDAVEEAPARAVSEPAEPSAPTAQSTARTPASRSATAAQRTVAKSVAAAKPAASAAPATAAAESNAEAAEPAAAAKAARARAVMQRSATAKYAREEAVTGEIPIVHIRSEAAEGHTTRQILLTGPIPVIDEATAAPAEDEDAKSSSASTESASESDAVTGTGLADDLAEAAPEPARAPQAKDAAPAVTDPFQQRLMARGGWSPTPLPVPSYVDAPEAEHAVPAAKAADASSYETEARSREDIAAQFAAELGYRNELSDSARDDSPLEHGRKAIRATKAPALDAVNDVLARRRA